MILTPEDIKAIDVALEPRFTKIDEHFTKIEEQISDLSHLSNRRFIAIEVRLDSIEYKIGQIGVFVPYELPPMKKT